MLNADGLAFYRRLDLRVIQTEVLPLVDRLFQRVKLEDDYE